MKDIVLNIEFQMTVQVPDDMTAEHVVFLYEKNHCISNLILEEARRIEGTPDVCNICERGKVTVLK